MLATYKHNNGTTGDIAIRHAVLQDVPHLQALFAHARGMMAATGNAHQWTDGYPDLELLHADIAGGDCYVVLKDAQIVATFVLRLGIDPTYNTIYNGQWLNDSPYATIHRIASNGKAKGIVHLAIQLALEQCCNIRIDTHRDNAIMHHILCKEGFKRCGIIYCSRQPPTAPIEKPSAVNERIAYHLAV